MGGGVIEVSLTAGKEIDEIREGEGKGKGKQVFYGKEKQKGC